MRNIRCEICEEELQRRGLRAFDVKVRKVQPGLLVELIHGRRDKATVDTRRRCDGRVVGEVGDRKSGGEGKERALV